MERYRQYLPLLIVVIALLTGGTIGVVIDEDGEGPAPPRTVIEIPTKAGPLQVSAAAVDKVEAKEPHQGERKETLSEQQRKDLNADAKQGTTGSDILPPIQLGASFSQAGCRTIPVVNQSRRSSRPGLGVAHYTVSGNRTGWGDVLAIVGLFNNPRFQASSNYVIDAEGHCAYIVPETAKAWTQGNMNGASACSVEQIGTGSDNGYRGAGLQKAAQVFRACFKRWGIPWRLGATSGCSIVRTGLVDHNELACGNNHTDIRPWPVSAILNAGGQPTSVLTSGEAKIIRATANPKGTGHSRKFWCAANTKQRHAIDAAKAHDGKPWSYRHRGARRHALGKSFDKRCH